MQTLDFSQHARAKPVEALAFRTASRYGPVYEGMIRTHVAVGMKSEKERQLGDGVETLARGAMERLSQRDGTKEKWSYTKKHSLDVAFFSFIMAREAIRNKIPEASALNAELCFAGGVVHDVGKTFLPMALIVKELGVDFGVFTLFRGERLNETELSVLREEHLTAGSRYVRLFGYNMDTRTILDIVGLHHVTYDGKDTGIPSYPGLLKGKWLPFHARIAKVADFISAVQPRHYRADNWVGNRKDAVAQAIAVAGRELDPTALCCFISCIYHVTLDEARALVSRLGCPGEGKELSFGRVKKHVQEVIEQDEEFKRITGLENREKIASCAKEAEACARKYRMDIGYADLIS